MRWRSFIHQGQAYDLSHLASFDWHYTAEASGNRPERTYKFQVNFSTHCFTRDPLPGEIVDNELWYTWDDDGKAQKRVFCFDRHDASHCLPDIIKSMGDRTCYHTHHGNYFTIELTTKKNIPVEYEVYFDVTRATRRGWLNLVVQSAYIRTEEYESTQPKRRKIRLDVIAYNTQAKKPIKPGR